jgi:hypothetical protein
MHRQQQKQWYTGKTKHYAHFHTVATTTDDDRQLSGRRSRNQQATKSTINDKRSKQMSMHQQQQEDENGKDNGYAQTETTQFTKMMHDRYINRTASHPLVNA